MEIASLMIIRFDSISIDLETSIMIIKDVPCHKCTQCGEVSFSLDVAESLEKVRFDKLDEDEKQAILQGREDYKNGNTYSLNEIDWDNLDKMDLE